MVMLMRTLLFPVDNGMDNNLTGDGLAAEYDIWTGRVTWRCLDDSRIKKQKKLVVILNTITALLSPIVVTVFVILVRKFGLFKLDIDTRIFQYSPLAIGGVSFLAFELIMLTVRSLYPKLDYVPSQKRQHEYFLSMYNNTIRENSVLPQYKTPFVGTYGAFLVAFIATPFCYRFYLQPDSFGDYLMGLFSVSVLVTLIPHFLWDILLKQLIYIKLIRKTKGQANE
ncbi:hypothetical protein [Streptococcus ferus]|uniref:hypothetical protein n=1 Tax=Streptococcus ferus TaxID=1345 RepID=UPI0035A1629E